MLIGMPVTRSPRLSVLLLGAILIVAIVPRYQSTDAQQKDTPRQLTQRESSSASELSKRRVALVMGNAKYITQPLPNPVNDSRDMHSTLRALGFDVVYGEDLTLAQMKEKLSEFGNKLDRNNGVGLFYFAGHGVQVNDRNYLIPVDTTTLRETTVSFEALEVDLVISTMASNSGVNVVILDACRNNPFRRSWRGGADGLAPINAPKGMLVAFATLPNAVADDGQGRNGLFTSELLKQIALPGLDIEQVFKRVRQRVSEITQGAQVPSVLTTIIGDFYLSDSLASNPVKPPTTEGSVVTRRVPKGANLPVRAYNSLSFNTVTINSQGLIRNPRQKQINYYVENIGGVSFEMVEIPAGRYLMGTSEREQEFILQEYQRNLVMPESSEEEKAEARAIAMKWLRKEMPQRLVNVPGFYMSRNEITQAQWRTVARLPKINRDLDPSPSRFKGDNLPVEQITWKDAMEFCLRLSKATKREYRLPSEAEWEYAARGGATTQFPLGDNIVPSLVNYSGESPFGLAPSEAGRGTTTPVGSLNNANGFGLLDMSGNVWEWCADVWHENYNGAPTNGEPWLKNGVGDNHVVRGGSWSDAASYCRSASRGRDAPRRRLTDRYGFRIAVAAK